MIEIQAKIHDAYGIMQVVKVVAEYVPQGKGGDYDEIIFEHFDYDKLIFNNMEVDFTELSEALGIEESLVEDIVEYQLYVKKYELDQAYALRNI